MDSPCEKIHDQLADYILGILNAEEINAIYQHTGQCPGCRQYMQALEDENRVLMQYGKDLEASMTVRQDRVVQALSHSVPTAHREPLSIWRIIMKSQITKLATAAVIIIAVVLSVTILDKSATPAWAIEDTAEALDQFNAVHIYGVAAPSLEALEQGFDKEIIGSLLKDRKMPIEVEFWAQANEQRTRSGNIRIETSDGLVGTADDTKTYIYDSASNTVYIQKGCHIMINPWLSGDFLLKVKEFTEDWHVTYGNDNTTGKNLAFITCTAPSLSHSMWIEIDLETNLPVRYKIWHNTERKGIPAYDMQRIIFFEKLLDERFQLQIPEGAKVVEYGFE